MLADWVYEYPKRAATIAIAAAIIIFALIWWNFIWQSPANVWQGMLKNNLATTSVTKHIVSKNSSESIDEYVRLDLGGTNASDWLVDVTQAKTSTVRTESIGTPSAGYIRYVGVQTSQKNAQGKDFDFSSITNTWGKSTDKSSSLTQLFSQSLLDLATAPLPPVGNVPADARGKIVSYINKQQVMVPDYKTMTRTHFQGHRVYDYTVAVKLEPYLLVMQAFAKEVGLHDLDDLDATQYANAKPVSLQFTVDSVSHQLVQVSYPTANYSQTYSDYGLMTPITVPIKTISVDALQARFTKLQ